MRWSPAPAEGGPITVTVPSQATLLDDLRHRIEDGQGAAVATLNVDHVVKLQRDAVFRNAYGRHTHVTADGRPIVWLSRLSGQPVELVTGSDLIAPLMALAADLTCPVALVGTTAPVLEAAATRLAQDHPGLRVVARISPEMGFDPDDAEADRIMAELEAKGARLVLLALGAPKQERLAARCRDQVPGACVVSIGAGLDFIAGTQRRAPQWMRALALEWLWRLSTDPKRLAARYAACAVLLPKLTVRAMFDRRRVP